MTTVPMGERADAPARRILEELEVVFLEAVKERLEHSAKVWPWTCGHVDPRDPRLLVFIGKDLGMTLYGILEGSSERNLALRACLRDALGTMGAYDGVSAEIHALGSAVRKREIYNIVRRAGKLLEQLGEEDPAAVLLEYAEQHEPVGDGVAFSRIRRRKGEAKR